MTGVEEMRRRLADERERVLVRLTGLQRDFDAMVAASRDTNADDEHDPEGATIAFERSQLAAHLRRAEDQLAEITAAMERLSTGTYGVCERCGSAIGAGRLEARPTTRWCIRCAG
jgi:DnaK suppressor protein